MADILILGDVHAEWGKLNTLINTKRPDIILQCGDFGYWPKFEDCSIDKIKPKNTLIYFCPGNHEDWDSLDLLTESHLTPNIHYMKKGSLLNLPDGRTVLFMGGAFSVDKAWRKPYYDWFPQEMITKQDILDLPDVNIDMVISHTCPNEFEMVGTLFTGGSKIDDPCRGYLSYILEKYKPAEWYFGHWHTYKTGNYNGCKWVGLNESRSSNWWVKL